MAATDAFWARTVRACREVVPVCRAFICCIALFLAASTSAQDGLAVISIDHFRTDRVNDESRHEILPPQDYFIDAFELEDGTAYLAFQRRDREAIRIRLYRLPQSGAPAFVFEDDLYGC